MAYRTALSVVHQIQLTRHGHGGSLPSARAAVQPPARLPLPAPPAARRIVVLPSRFSTAARSSTLVAVSARRVTALLYYYVLEGNAALLHSELKGRIINMV